MSKTEKVLFIIAGILTIIWVAAFVFILVYVPQKLRNRAESQKFPFIYVSSSPEIHLLWNPSELIYTGVTEINGKTEEFILAHDHDKVYAFPTKHFVHIDHPDLFSNEVCKCTPLFMGVSTYYTKEFSIEVTEDNAGVFDGELPLLTFARYDIKKYKGGAFADDTGFNFQYGNTIEVSEAYGISLIRDDVEGVFVGTCECNGEKVDFVLYEEEDNFYALPVSHLAHMAHPSLFPDDECIKEPLFEGKTVYGNGLTELHITKDSAGIFGGSLPKITLSRFDKQEYFGEK